MFSRFQQCIIFPGNLSVNDDTLDLEWVFQGVLVGNCIVGMFLLLSNRFLCCYGRIITWLTWSNSRLTRRLICDSVVISCSRLPMTALETFQQSKFIPSSISFWRSWPDCQAAAVELFPCISCQNRNMIQSSWQDVEVEEVWGFVSKQEIKLCIMIMR